MDFEALLKMDGEGRNVLEGRVRLLVQACRNFVATNSQLNAQLTDAQERCTELLEENRRLSSQVAAASSDAHRT